jgi:CheY-like chemotaxis protein
MSIEISRTDLLLVEDCEDDAYFFKRTLQKCEADCTLHRASNGAEAIDFLQIASTSGCRALPRVMFLDLKMPILNGFEVLEWLQVQPFATQIKVIVLSGSEQQSDKERATRLGAADYLVKPVKVSDLNRLLGNVCPANSHSQMGAPV